METRPADTTAEAWREQQAALSRIGPAGRVDAAIELSEMVRELQIAGIRSRNPEWSRSDAVRHLISTRFGIDPTVAS